MMSSDRRRSIMYELDDHQPETRLLTMHHSIRAGTEHRTRSSRESL